MFWAAEVRLRRTTARLPVPASALPYTCSPLVSSATLTPCRPRGSWSTATTSGFFSIEAVSEVMVVRSLPARSGAPEIAHRFIWVRFWAAVKPSMPTISMSGSL